MVESYFTLYSLQAYLVLKVSQENRVLLGHRGTADQQVIQDIIFFLKRLFLSIVIIKFSVYQVYFHLFCRT